jgi:hypothetical protein
MISSMLDLHDELQELLSGLDAQRIPYALCGGLAMAVHGVPRATIDIDILIDPAQLDQARHVAEGLGYTLDALPMSFAGGAVEIRRVSKIDPELGDALSLDLILATPELRQVFEGRQQFSWGRGTLWVVSREGLVAMKRLRFSGIDRDDIQRLEESR